MHCNTIEKWYTTMKFQYRDFQYYILYKTYYIYIYDTYIKNIDLFMLKI